MVYADDATGAGSFERLRQWWDQVECLGPTFGYYPNGAKTYLNVKEEHEIKAKALFADTDVHITINGKRHLHVGAALGFARRAPPRVRTAYWLSQRHTHVSHKVGTGISGPRFILLSNNRLLLHVDLTYIVTIGIIQ